jgi:hypothetical protein
MSTTPHLLISSFDNVSDQLFFISYYMSMSSQPCFPHLLCSVYYTPNLFQHLHLMKCFIIYKKALD